MKQTDEPPGFFDRISNCDVSLRKRQRQRPVSGSSMASSRPSNTSQPPLLLLPPETEQAPPPAHPLVLEAMPKPRRTVADNVLGLLRSGQAFIRGAFRRGNNNSSHATPARAQLQPQPQPQPQHHHHLHNRPGDIMKRLQREAFPDVMKLVDKHEQIERIFSMYRSGMGFHFPDVPVRAKVVLDAVGALLLVDDDDFGHAREILGKAGNTTGLGQRFVLESKTRGRDTIAAELSTRIGPGVGNGGEAPGRPLELARLQYCAHVNDWLTMVLVPFGAQCNSFLHGSSLIENLRGQAPLDGPPSFYEQHNCGAGLSIRGSNFTASLAELIFGSGAQDGDHRVANRMTTFGQVCYKPADDAKLSLSAQWQICPVSSRFNNLGTLAIPLGSLQLPTNNPPLVAAAGAARNNHAPRAATQSIAVMLDCELYKAMRAEGWVEMERRPGQGPVRWGCCLSDTPEHELGWGVRMGGTAEGEKHRPHLEGFLSFNLGRGGKLQPGLVYVMEGEKQTPALVLRSTWFM